MTPTIAPPIYGLLISTTVMIAGGQILFKMASDKLNTSELPFYSLAFSPVFIAALAIYGLATLMWVYALKAVPLAYAYSFMGLTYVIVPLLAVYFLGETLSFKYAIGAFCIIAGLLIIHN